MAPSAVSSSEQATGSRASRHSGRGRLAASRAARAGAPAGGAPAGLPAAAPAQRPRAAAGRADQRRRPPPASLAPAHLQRAPAGLPTPRRSLPARRRPRASPAVAALRGLQREVHARGPRERQQHFGNVKLGRRGGGPQRQQPREREQQRRQPPAPRRHPRRTSPPATRRLAARARPLAPSSPARARRAGR